jgi:membrane protease YdiL (CAAX protease family)
VTAWEPPAAAVEVIGMSAPVVSGRQAGGPWADTAPARGRWKGLAAVEVTLAAAAVLLDLAIPTFVILALATASLVVRRQGLSSLGLRRVDQGWRLAAKMLLFALAWTLLQLTLVMPVTNHLTGTRQDMSDFAALEGNLAMLLGLLALSWTLAAIGEEVAYRGFVLTRMAQVVGASGVRLAVAAVLSAVLFGMAHTEQGVVGVVLTTIDALGFTVLRYHYGTLWASILAHGFNNTIGFIAFFFAGPIYGLW